MEILNKKITKVPYWKYRLGWITWGIYVSFTGFKPSPSAFIVVKHVFVQSVWRKKGKRKVQGVSQSQTVALPRPQEEEETDRSKQAQTEQTYEKH